MPKPTVHVVISAIEPGKGEVKLKDFTITDDEAEDDIQLAHDVVDALKLYFTLEKTA